MFLGPVPLSSVITSVISLHTPVITLDARVITPDTPPASLETPRDREDLTSSVAAQIRSSRCGAPTSPPAERSAARVDVHPEIIAAIPLATGMCLFEALGAPRGICTSPRAHDEIAAALRKRDLEPPLTDALHTIAAFETEDGRVRIYNAAAALGFTRLPRHATSPSDLVGRLLRSAASDKAVAELMVTALVLREQASPPRATPVFVGRAGVDPGVGEPAHDVDAPTREVTAWARARGFGDVVSVTPGAAAGVLSYELVQEGGPATLCTRAGTHVAPADHRHRLVSPIFA